MKIHVDNLYLHADGGYYCLLIDDAPMKHPDTGEWIPGVIYVGTDGQSRSTSRARWDERFSPVAEYDGDTAEDDEVVVMIRRCNPGDSDLDFIRVFESWHESEINITGNMLELAVAAAMHQLLPATLVDSAEGTSLIITTQDLQEVAQNYEIERIPTPHGFQFRVRKSFPDSA
jgi:hypothetical protein